MAGGRVTANGKDNGAGFAVCPRVVLTANHVVRDQEAPSLKFIPENGVEVEIESVERDVMLDVALLHLKKDVTEMLKVGTAADGLGWRVEMRPGPRDAWLHGTVTVARRPYTNQQVHETYVMQLHVDENLMEYQGYSGSPVVLASTPWVVVGVLVEELRVRIARQDGQPVPASNVLFATPLEDINQGFRLDLPLLPPPEPPTTWGPRHTPLSPQELRAKESVYRQQVVQTYSLVGFRGIGFPDPKIPEVPLEHVFVRLSLTEEKPRPAPTAPDGREHNTQHGHISGQRSETVQEPIALGNALRTNLLLVGEPGAGKSTLLRWLAVTFAQERQREADHLGPGADADRIPLSVELGKLPDAYVAGERPQEPIWRDLVPEHVVSQPAFADTDPQMLRQVIADGRALLLFDGLDEVVSPMARATIVTSLVEFARLSPGNRIVIGSRPSGVSAREGIFPHPFRRCQIEPFTPQDVQQFFRFWYALDPTLPPADQVAGADRLYAEVEANPRVLALAATPLLSTMLVLIWRTDGTFLEQRVSLYARCCQILLEPWERHHVVAPNATDLTVWKALNALDAEDLLDLLAPLAFAINSRGQLGRGSDNGLIPLLQERLLTQKIWKESISELEAKQFLKTLGLRSGLFQAQGDGSYAFPHQTFQEYLAARHLASLPEPVCRAHVTAHLDEAWWREVHILTIGILGSDQKGAAQASSLMLAILNRYPLPSRLLDLALKPWPRRFAPGRYLRAVQLERRIACVLAREFELAGAAYLECTPDGVTPDVTAVLSQLVADLVREAVRRNDLYQAHERLLLLAGRLMQSGDIHAAVTKILRKALADDSNLVRGYAAEVLGELGRSSDEVIAALLNALAGDDYVRPQAAAALGKLGQASDEVIVALFNALAGDDYVFRQQAAEALGKLGQASDEVISVLLKALAEDKGFVREQAAEVLGELGRSSDEVIAALLNALADNDNFVRWQAAEALGKLGHASDEVISVLLITLADNDYVVRWRAARVLGTVRITQNGRCLREVLRALTHLFYHDDANVVRYEALVAIRRLLDGRSIPSGRAISDRRD